MVILKFCARKRRINIIASYFDPMPLTEANSIEERNKTLISSFIEEIFNKHNLLSIEKYFDKNTIENGPQAGKGGEGFKQFLTEFFSAFPHWHTTIEYIVAENNLVVVFLNGNGTHRGEFQGIPPTNKSVNIKSADLYKIESGIITGHWDVVDQLNLLKQTGVLLHGKKN
jgi:predicted ester cyclase